MPREVLGTKCILERVEKCFVDTSANKIEIKQAIEDIYKVKVESVNTLIRPGKPKRVRYTAGKTSEWKEAVVTLKEGSKIDVT